MVNSTVEKLSPTRVKLHITVTPDELKPSIAHAYEHIAQDVQIPGFRKGKVPAPIIDQRVGRGAVLEHAVSEGLDTFYRDAVAANELRVLGRPKRRGHRVAEREGLLGRPQGRGRGRRASRVRPSRARGHDRRPSTPSRSTRPRSTRSSTACARRFGTLVTVDRPAATGDFVELDLVATIGDAEIDRAEGVSYEVGSGELLEGIDEAIDSLTAGEDTTFRSKLVGGDHAGEEAEVSVTVTAVKERELPEADDDFAQIASEFDTIAELRESLEGARRTAVRLRAGLGSPRQAHRAAARAGRDPRARRSSSRTRCTTTSRAKAVSRTTCTAPRSTEASEKQFRTQMLLDAIAEKLDVSVSQDELTQYLVQSAAQYGMPPQEFVTALQENNQLPAMVGEVARNKALAVALGKVSVVDTNGKPVDLSGFIAVDDEDDAEEVVEEAEEIADAAAEADEIIEAEEAAWPKRSRPRRLRPASCAKKAAADRVVARGSTRGRMPRHPSPSSEEEPCRSGTSGSAVWADDG